MNKLTPATATTLSWAQLLEIRASDPDGAEVRAALDPADDPIRRLVAFGRLAEAWNAKHGIITEHTLDDDQVFQLAEEGEISDYRCDVARGIQTPHGSDTTSQIRREVAAIWNQKHGVCR